MFRRNFSKKLLFSAAVAAIALSASFVSADVICAKAPNGANGGTITVRPSCRSNETRLSNRKALDNLGSITGVYHPYSAGCAANSQSNLNGRVEIGGTSYSASFLADGSFTIFNVRPGTYTVSLTQLNGNSYARASTSGFGVSIASNVQVVANHETDVGTINGTTCCGNSTVESPEQCDGSSLNGETCVSLGYTSGTLACRATCSFDTSNCVS